MNHFERAFEEVSVLAHKFQQNQKHYLSPTYQEAEARKEFIDKFFKALGWDVDHDHQHNPYEQEVKIEKAQKQQNSVAQKRADYAFYMQPNFKDVQFFVEAKKPSVDIKHADHYFQTIRYGWNAQTPIAVLTDFEQFHIIDCRSKPNINYVFNGAHKEYRFTDYTDKEKFAEIYYLFSRESVADDSLVKYAEKLPKAKGKAVQKTLFPGAYQDIDDSFLAYIDDIRENLAKAFKKNDETLDSEALTEATQRTVDRLVFIRFLEDKLIEPHNHISEYGLQGKSVWKDFVSDCRALDAKYNGVVFKKHFIDEQNFVGADEKLFADICSDISNVNSPYHFNYIPIHILGSIYERFLGKVVRATDKRVFIEEKPEVRKAGGVYYTPKYIVDYIVQNTVGKLIENKKPAEIAEMHFADIACGSGSFLIGVYGCLLKYHADFYQHNASQAKKDGCELRDGQYVLTLKQKQDILLNNVYGVDIDFSATEVTQLSLFLKMLEDETLSSTQKQGTLFLKVLPDLSNNIKCGNSLIGTDILSGQLFTFDEEKALNAFDYKSAFPKVFKNGGFDAIVGNPPYVFTRDVDWPDTIKKYYWDKFNISKDEISKKNQSGKVNLYVLFLLNGNQLINKSGLLSYIIPNGILRTTTYDTTRKHLLQNSSILEIVDLKDGVFKGVTASTVILILGSFDSKNEIKIIDANYKRDGLIDNNIFSNILQSKLLSNTSYAISLFINEDESIIFNKMNSSGSFFKDIVIDIIEGIVAHKEFIKNEKLNEKYLPLIEGKDIKRFSINFGGNFILYNRKKLHRPRPEYVWNAEEKILIQRISGGKMPLVAAIDYDKNLSFASTNVILIKEDWVKTFNYKIVCALLNSKLINFYYYKNFTNASNLTVNISKTYVEMLPLPKVDSLIFQKLVNLVEQMLQAKQQLQSSKNEKDQNYLSQKCETLDKQIDNLVYQLYNLSDEEIKIIENN